MAVARARAFLSQHAGLFDNLDDSFVLDEHWTGRIGNEADRLLVTFRSQPHGVEQHDGRLTFVIAHGNLIQIDAERLNSAPADAQPRLTVDEAFTRLRAAAGMTSEPTVIKQELKFVNLAATHEAPGVYTGPAGRGYDQHLAHVFHFKLPDDRKTYVGYVDARTGELLELFDDNLYDEVYGGIYPFSPATNISEVLMPFGKADVNNLGITRTTNLGGQYAFQSGAAFTTLSGKFFSVTDACGSGAMPLAVSSGSTGDLDLGVSGSSVDCRLSFTGRSTRAARNAFYHLNDVRQIGLKWLAGGISGKWLISNVVATVNLPNPPSLVPGDGACDSFWDGIAVNYQVSYQAPWLNCTNPGHIADWIRHEWGHGLDQNSKGGTSPSAVGDVAKAEAIADLTAFLMSHDKCWGPGWYSNGSGGSTACPSARRDLSLVVTLANVKTICNSNSNVGALGFEAHCEGHILSGAMFDLALSLVQRHGPQEGWQQFERLMLFALPNMTAYLPNTAGNAYDAVMAADDDNGNIADGTPHADLIFQAFNRHGIAGTQRPIKVATCQPRPAAPVLQASAQNMSVVLTWNNVGGTFYVLFRNITSAGMIGSIPASFLTIKNGAAGGRFTDNEVADGYTYNYVMVADVGGCQSPVSAPVSARVCTPCTIGSFDGANCYVGAPPAGTTPFIFGKSLYYTPVRNACPLPRSTFDGLNCFVAEAPKGTHPYVYMTTPFVVGQDLFYTPAPNNTCPLVGSSHRDGNCFVATAPAGTTAFVYGRSLYYTPEPSCPLAGSVLDSANCFVATAPARTTPFVYNGNLYYSAICH